MVYIKKIFGRAGTGKTYALTKDIEVLLNSGVSIRNIAMVTHTKIGVHVFRSRMINELKIDSNDLIYFGTMHSLSWRRQGLRSDNIFGKPQEQEFLETYYPDMIKVPDEYPIEEFYLDSTDKARMSGRSKIKAMIEIDGTLSGCMITDFDFIKMRKMTGRTLGYTNYYVNDASRWSDKHDKRVLDWGRQFENIDPKEQREFSEHFREYLTVNDLFSHARNLEEMHESKSYIPAKYLFFDEFQDFAQLQYAIYMNWTSAPGVERVTIAGDDCQTIFRFSSASAQHMIKTRADEVVKLNKTYRHGAAILDNANVLHEYMRVVEPVAVEPADNTPGEIVHCSGDTWKESIDFSDPNESVLVLASTGDWVKRVKKDLHGLFPDVVFVSLEDTRVVERVFGMYNVLAAIERGEEVDGDAHDHDDKWNNVAALFKHTPSLPQKMFYQQPQTVLAGNALPTMTKVTNGVKAGIRRGTFRLRDVYTKATFEKDFLKVPWIGRYLINAIPDIAIFPQAPDVFPDYAEPKVNKRIGTIHKAKGDEADTVLLFMGVSQPALFEIHEPDVADDVLRQFYVGKTRPRTKLIEVYDYLKYSNGEVAPSPLEMLGT